MLRQMNIHHASLFPDPGGASLYCNDWLSRCVEENKERDKLLQQEKSKIVRKKLKLELSDIAQSDTEIVTKVQQVIEQIVDEEDVSKDEISTWAMKIDAKYNEEASIDWPKHQSGLSKIRITFRRLLVMLDCPEEKRDELVEALITFYRKLYEGKAS